MHGVDLPRVSYIAFAFDLIVSLSRKRLDRISRGAIARAQADGGGREMSTDDSGFSKDVGLSDRCPLNICNETVEEITLATIHAY